METDIIRVHGSRLSSRQLKTICSVLRRGGVILYPTDSSYGIGGDWTNPKAYRKVISIKQRPPQKEFPVIVGSVQHAKQIVHWNITTDALVKKYWPGLLTLVLPLKRSRASLAIRIPSHPIALQITKALKKPLISTSANVSNKPACYSVSSFLRQLSRVPQRVRRMPDLIIDAGALPHRKPSTIIDLHNPHHPYIIRQGDVRVVY